MIVVDASAAVSALLNAGPASRTLGAEELHVPHLIDSEIANAVRLQVAAGRLDSAAAWTVGWVGFPGPVVPSPSCPDSQR